MAASPDVIVPPYMEKQWEKERIERLEKLKKEKEKEAKKKAKAEKKAAKKKAKAAKKQAKAEAKAAKSEAKKAKAEAKKAKDVVTKTNATTHTQQLASIIEVNPSAPESASVSTFPTMGVISTVLLLAACLTFILKVRSGHKR